MDLFLAISSRFSPSKGRFLSVFTDVTRTLLQPQSCPLPFSVISSAILILMASSWSLSSIRSVPPSYVQTGRRLLRKVLPAT